jgi:hypothetical protein
MTTCAPPAKGHKLRGCGLFGRSHQKGMDCCEDIGCGSSTYYGKSMPHYETGPLDKQNMIPTPGFAPAPEFAPTPGFAPAPTELAPPAEEDTPTPAEIAPEPTPDTTPVNVDRSAAWRPQLRTVSLTGVVEL